MSEIYELDSDEEVAFAAATFVLLSGELLKKPVKRKRRFWMASLNKNRKRYNASDMLTDLRKEPSGKFENFCRMSATDFEHLLCRIGILIARRETNMGESIPMQERLAVALRFSATGDSYASLPFFV
ncbi:hypothetical protein AVEN_271147-1 [Araneus ventricosus]|uniref:Uncharacterized protein n=1 Tax=Araneus ventricosus TaxID=182803 RepID=A0A4Y2E7F4_ARAVE|nr:hypothetical protein AVEN_271147-1 [Araneus ventricosus]